MLHCVSRCWWRIRRDCMAEWAEVNGTCLRYEQRGCHGPWTVLLHEMGGCIESWDGVVAELDDSVRVLRFDQRGFGLSEKACQVRIDMGTLVDDLTALLDSLGITEPVVLVGAALGAAHALAYAARWPQRVGGLVISSPATGGSSPASRSAMEARHDAIRRGGMRAVTNAMMAITYPPHVAWDPDAFRQHRRRWLGTDPGAFVAVNDMLAQTDLQPSLATITTPTLVIGCTHDTIRSPARSAEVAQLLQNARFVECASGHYMPLQHPKAFVAELKAFLSTLYGVFA